MSKRGKKNTAAGRTIFQVLGPGFISGAADDDPSGIGTYSQAGAQYGFSLLWTLLWTYPLLSAVQEISARIGRATGQGIAANLRRHYPKWFGGPVVFLIFVANALNIGADLGAMGASANMLFGGSALVFDVLISIICFFLPAYLSYKTYAKILKWGALVLLAYVIVMFLPGAKVPWGHSLAATLIPTFHWEKDYWGIIVGVLGTTISPYVFFWQASEEAEEVKVAREDKALKKAPEQADDQFRRIRIDTYFGMFFSNAISWFIMLAACVFLYQNGSHDIESAQQAASALKPFGGMIASIIFTAGIFGTGFHAVPILAGATAYAVGEEYKERVGIDYSPPKAPFFYLVFAITTLLGLAINFTSINPIKALLWSAIINGVVAVPVMVAMMLMVRNEKVMGPVAERGRFLIPMGWITTAIMLVAVVAMFATL